MWDLEVFFVGERKLDLLCSQSATPAPALLFLILLLFLLLRQRKSFRVRVFCFLNIEQFSVLLSQSAWVFPKMGFESGQFRARRIWDVCHFWKLPLNVCIPIGINYQTLSTISHPKRLTCRCQNMLFFLLSRLLAPYGIFNFFLLSEIIYRGGTHFTGFILDSARTMHWSAKRFINQEQCGKSIVEGYAYEKWSRPRRIVVTHVTSPILHAAMLFCYI